MAEDSSRAKPNEGEAGTATDAEAGDGVLPEVDLDKVEAEMAAAEAFVEERVQRSLARYRGMFPPEVLEEFADELRCFLLTHPVASKMLDRIRPRSIPMQSTERETVGAHQRGVPASRKGKLG
jgi:hypothetical protein